VSIKPEKLLQPEVFKMNPNMWPVSRGTKRLKIDWKRIIAIAIICSIIDLILHAFLG